MKDTTKKVVILENLSSPYVHQAIIVMREFDPKLESRAVTEAERIVSAYLDNMKLNADSKKRGSKTSDCRILNSGRQKNAVRRKRFFPYFIAAVILLIIAAVIFRF